MIRKAKAVWRGTGRDGSGGLSTDSGVLAETPYSFKTRFESERGTNPRSQVGGRVSWGTVERGPGRIAPRLLTPRRSHPTVSGS